MMEQILKTIMVIISVILTSVILPYLKNKTNNAKYDKLLVYIEYAVRSAEQLYKVGQSKEKKEYVYNYILEKSQKIAPNLNEEDVDVLIEGVVNMIKH